MAVHSVRGLQEVLGALLASTGGAAAGEVTAALEVLVQLAEEETADLLKFASFIGMLLDYLANFTNAQLHLVRAHRDTAISSLLAGLGP